MGLDPATPASLERGRRHDAASTMMAHPGLAAQAKTRSVLCAEEHGARHGSAARLAPCGPTLFEFAGGEPAFLALAAAHHARCLSDPELNHPFSHPDQHPQHVERLAAYWAEVMGGPARYSQSCGDHSGMLQMHAGNGDLGDLGRRFVDCFVCAIDDAGLSEDPDFRAALLAYMRWAVDEVLRYPSPEDAVPPGLAMPHWSWDGPAASG